MRAEFLLDYDVLTVEQEHKLYLLARLEAGPAPEDAQRRPLNLSLVVDKSGSMAGSKIDYTRQAAQLLVQNMSNEDTLSVVLYNEVVETLLPAQQVQHKDMINQRIAEIKAGGTTNLSSGWLEGVNNVSQNLNDTSMNRVILMSDGHANRGITDPVKLISIAKQKFGSGVSTTTMGLGDDFNEDLLMAMADAGGGAFYFIESPEVTPTIFQEELTGLLSVVGQNLSIAIEPSDHVKGIRQLNAYQETRGTDRTTFRLGDVFGNEVKSLMLELAIPALKTIGEVEIANLIFEYDELRGENTEHHTFNLAVRVNVAPPELVSGEENIEVKRSVLLLKAAEARRDAVELADSGKYGEAAKKLRTAAEEIREAELADDEVLEEERSALVTQAQDMDKGATYYQSYSRKSMATQSYMTQHGNHESTQVLRNREKERMNRQAKQTQSAESGEMKTGLYEMEMPPPEPIKPDTGKLPSQMRWGEKVYILNKDLMRIGRAPQNEIVMNATGISRFHAQIKKAGNHWVLEDLNSTNGTHVRGIRLEKEHVLRDGDVVYLCDQRVTFTA